MTRITVILLALSTIILPGCGEGWVMDYGTPTAQFSADNLPSAGGTYIGKKVTIKGVVTHRNKSGVVVLNDKIECTPGNVSINAKVGETVYVDGILREWSADKIKLEPAMGRDPNASFEPVK